jgi:molybdopterin molybdotransferase
MISFENALELTLDVDVTLASETDNFLNSLNRVIAQDVLSDIDMPPFNKSAMDGFAISNEDINNFCEVIEVIPAGKIPQKIINKKQCSKIMTGAMLPDGADRVIPIEDVIFDEKSYIKCVKEQKFDNICYKSEDIKKGDVVIKKGTLIKAHHIAVLASVGCVNPLLYKKIKIFIAATGDELTEPDTLPGKAMIRNSNAYQLLSQIENTGAIGVYKGIIPDTEKDTKQFIENAFENADVVIMSGGVSMGDFDFIPDALKNIGADIIYKSVAIKPGRPTVFAKKNNKFFFGLPGNPVSSYSIFELLVKPLLMKMTGSVYKKLTLKMPLNQDYFRKKAKRLEAIPVNIINGESVIPIEYHGSAHINALTDADGFAFIPVGIKNLKKGDIVDVRLL